MRRMSESRRRTRVNMGIIRVMEAVLSQNQMMKIIVPS